MHVCIVGMHIHVCENVHVMCMCVCSCMFCVCTVYRYYVSMCTSQGSVTIATGKCTHLAGGQFPRLTEDLC